MRLEKGMSLTQKRTLKEILKENMGYACIIPDDFTDWGWQITDVHTIAWRDMKIVIYTIKNKTIQMGVQVNEEVLRIYFSPWCDWKENYTSLGEKYYYKTNQRLTFVKKEYDGKVFKGWSACHAEDVYNLNEGLKLALYRVDEKIKVYKEEKEKAEIMFKEELDYQLSMIKKINLEPLKAVQFKSNKDIDIGSHFGDLEVIAYMGKDGSRHHLWKCRCKCGNVIIVRSTNLRNQSKTSCGKCKIKHPVWGNTTEAEKKRIADFINPATVKIEESHYDFTSDLEKYDNLTIVEKEGELLEAPCYNTMVHVISADYPIKGATGTTKTIIDLFNIHGSITEELRFLQTIEEYDSEAKVVGSLISHPTNVLSLVVKDSRYDTVSYDTMAIVFRKLKNYICRNKISYIAMPRICCGMEKLDWEQIKQMLIDEFCDIKQPLTITVYYK